jgi:hypothetical protein
LVAFTGHEAMTRLDEDLACLTRAKPEGGIQGGIEGMPVRPPQNPL